MRRFRSTTHRRNVRTGRSVNRANVNPQPTNIGDGAPNYPRRPVPSDPLCPCWCERHTGPVPLDDIARGLTWSCGHPKCRPPNPEGTP